MGTWSNRISDTRQNHFDTTNFEQIRMVFGLNHQKFWFNALKHLFQIVFHSKLFAILFRKPNKFDWRHVSNTSCVLHFTGFRTHSNGIGCVYVHETLTTESRKWHKSVGIVSFAQFKQAVRLICTICRQANNFYSVSVKLPISLILRRLMVLFRAHSPLDDRLCCLSGNIKFKPNATALNKWQFIEY